MNPMSGPQNPAPPYTRPAGPNQQAQHNQYHHQVDIVNKIQLFNVKTFVWLIQLLSCKGQYKRILFL